MRISEMTTDKAADVLMLITPEIEIIARDAELMAEINKRVKVEDNATQEEKDAAKEKATEIGIQKIIYLIPAILGKYRQNVYRILSAVTDKTPDEIAAQGITDTIKQVREIFSDKELLSFFTSSTKTAQSE